MARRRVQLNKKPTIADDEATQTTLNFGQVELTTTDSTALPSDVEEPEGPNSEAFVAVLADARTPSTAEKISDSGPPTVAQKAEKPRYDELAAYTGKPPPSPASLGGPTKPIVLDEDSSSDSDSVARKPKAIKKTSATDDRHPRPFPTPPPGAPFRPRRLNHFHANNQCLLDRNWRGLNSPADNDRTATTSARSAPSPSSPIAGTAFHGYTPLNPSPISRDRRSYPTRIDSVASSVETLASLS